MDPKLSMNYNGWEAMIFIGVCAAISVRVSNELGLRHPRATKYSVYVTVFQSLINGIFMAVILVTKDHFAIVFTNSKPLQEAVAKLASLLAVTMILNSVQPVISGVAIGVGWQALVAYINGLWGGMICGMALQTLLLLLILYKINWKKEVDVETERVLKWDGQVEKTVASA